MSHQIRAICGISVEVYPTCFDFRTTLSGSAFVKQKLQIAFGLLEEQEAPRLTILLKVVQLAVRYSNDIGNDKEHKV